MLIPLHCFETLSSTSDLAQQWLRAGRKPPFAVLAQSQTQGRGRRGHSWVSPKGNLYLSLALSLNQADAHQSLIPLKVALLIALWLEAHFGLKVTLKWPNDLYYRGQKLGGILCEASCRGDGRSELLVGIGLNVSVSPGGFLDGAYKAICLAECLEGSLSESLEEKRQGEWQPPSLARSLLDFWQETWEALPLDGAGVVAAIQSFRSGPSQLWQRKGCFYREEGLDDEGRLWLQPLKISGEEQGQSVCLSSAHHDFVWVSPLSSPPCPLNWINV